MRPLSLAQLEALDGMRDGPWSATWVQFNYAANTITSLVRYGLIEGCGVRSVTGGLVPGWRITREGRAYLREQKRGAR